MLALTLALTHTHTLTPSLSPLTAHPSLLTPLTAHPVTLTPHRSPLSPLTPSLSPSPSLAVTLHPHPHPHPRPRPHPHPSFKTTITELLKAMKKQALADGRTGVHTDINHQDKAGKTPLYLAVEHRVPGQTRAIEARACCSAPWATLTHTFHPSPSPFTLTLLPASTLTQPLTLLTVTQALDPTLTLQNQEMIRHLFDKEIVPSNEQPDYLHVNSEGWTIMHAGVFADNVDVLKSVLAHITPQRQM